MRRLILSALLLAAATPVLAQLPPPDVRDEHRDDRDRRDGGQRPDDRRPDQRPDDRGGYRPDDRGPRPDDRGQRPDDRRDYRQDERRDFRQDGRDFRQDERRDFRDDRRGYGDRDQFARFHADRYYYPRGYGYRYFGVGAFLPRVFWSQRYYIADPFAYRLPPAFAGTHWVRYGPDALLVRNYDGRVVRVIQGLFY